MSERGPNILLITSDQQHPDALGVCNPQLRTPHLDRLAREGTLLTRAYCTNPTCTPSRASILTGQMPSRHGAWSLGTQLDPRRHTIGEDFQAHGWRTALIGKAHFQPLASSEGAPSLEAAPALHDAEFWRGFHGPFYGFEHVDLARNHTSEAHVGQHYALWMEERGLTNWRDYFRPPTGTLPHTTRHKWALPEAFHQDAWIAERTEARLEQYRRDDAPFFLWASFFDPHPAYLAPEPWDTMYDPAELDVPTATPGEHDRNPPLHRLTQQTEPDFTPWHETGFHCHGLQSHRHDRAALQRDTAVYYGMISLMDKYIGRILDRLDALGLADQTLVVFTSDHGHLIGHHGLIAKGPFHYEDMVRVPTIVRWPGRIEAGRRCGALQSLADLAPTWLSLAGLPVPHSMTGVDQGEVWLGRRESARRRVVVENRHEPTTIHLKTLIDERYKLTVYYDRPYGELFDLETDPGETRNLWDTPSAQELKTRLLLDLISAGMDNEPLETQRVAGA